jgi:hypothetical protein
MQESWGILAQPLLEGVMGIEVRYLSAVYGRPCLAHLTNFLFAHLAKPNPVFSRAGSPLMMGQRKFPCWP